MVDPKVRHANAAEALHVAAEEIGRARRQLGGGGAGVVDRVRTELETTVAHLDWVAVDPELPGLVRQRAQRCRDAISTHLLAARGLEEAGVSRQKVVGLLHRATTVSESAVASGH